MTNHSYKGLTQPLQTDTANPRPAKHRVLGVTIDTIYLRTRDWKRRVFSRTIRTPTAT